MSSERRGEESDEELSEIEPQSPKEPVSILYMLFEKSFLFRLFPSIKRLKEKKK
jgi:hypothetical protein